MNPIKTCQSILYLAFLTGLLGTGCQTYKPPVETWRSGNVQEAAKQFTAIAEKKKESKDAVIWRLEQGAVLRAAAQLRESNAALDAAEEKINARDQEAKVSLSQETVALLSNQATLPYEGRDYDKVMLNAYKALNYIQLGEPDKARVELVRASQRQQDAEENSKRRIQRNEEAAEKLKDSKEKNADKASVAADKASVAADKAKVSADKAVVSADEAKVSADEAKGSADGAKESADKAKESADKAKETADKTKETADKTMETADKAKAKESADKAKAKEMADKAKADPKFTQQIAANYGYLDGFKAKTNYVNPFVYYLDALFFLTANADRSDLERARDSFRFTLGSIGENRFIKQDLEMVDAALQGTPVPATTYVIFETGSAPIRGQIRIDVPLFIAGVSDVPYIGAAFPTLKLQDGHLPSLNVAAGGTNETTMLLSSMDSIVGQAFKDELPTIITKTLVSTAFKAAAFYGVSKSVEKQSFWTKLAVKAMLVIVQASVNIADTRTWNTLPKEVQFCRIPTPSDRKITLSGPSGMSKVEVTLCEGTVNLIHVRSVSATNALLVTQIKLK